MEVVSRFTSIGDDLYFPICNNCKNYIKDLQCSAFLVVPDEILNGEFDHRNPYPGDNGIRFEPIKEPEKFVSRSQERRVRIMRGED